MRPETIENRRKQRIGEKQKMNCGYVAEIIEYRSCQDMDIQFEDGTVRKSVKYAQFIRGQYKHPTLPRKSPIASKCDRIGEVFVLNNGLTAKIIAYRSCRDLDVECSDGSVFKGIRYEVIATGRLRCPIQYRELDDCAVVEVAYAADGEAKQFTFTVDKEDINRLRDTFFRYTESNGHIRATRTDNATCKKIVAKFLLNIGNKRSIMYRDGDHTNLRKSNLIINRRTRKSPWRRDARNKNNPYIVRVDQRYIGAFPTKELARKAYEEATRAEFS